MDKFHSAISDYEWKKYKNLIQMPWWTEYVLSRRFNENLEIAYLQPQPLQ